MMDKETYKSLNDKLPIFLKSWWLDAVCEGGEWRAESYGVNGNIESVFVYFIKKKFGFKYIVMPQLTQFLGEYHIVDNQSVNKPISYGKRKEISNYFIDLLPNTAFSTICMNRSFQYWSPYFWKGFNQTTKYSYRISKELQMSQIYSNFEYSKQKNIRKAEKVVTVQFDMSPEAFYEHHRQTLAEQNRKISYSYNLFKNIYDACRANDNCRILSAVDSDGNIQCALFVIWDENSLYTLISSFPSKYRNFGTGDLLMYKAIELAKMMELDFDFEGSMIENVETSFRRFGAIPVEYYQIFKSNKFFSIINIFHKLF